MSGFLRQWDTLIEQAKLEGDCVYMWTYEGPYIGPDLVADNLKLSARTMHPSFMAATPPKYDPTRDKKD